MISCPICEEVWSLLLQLREEGLCKAVGVSNFGVGQLEGEPSGNRLVFALLQPFSTCLKMLHFLAESMKRV